MDLLPAIANVNITGNFQIDSGVNLEFNTVAVEITVSNKAHCLLAQGKGITQHTQLSLPVETSKLNIESGAAIIFSG
jgi:hypothetical protein